jgi:hypothetical protein
MLTLMRPVLSSSARKLLNQQVGEKAHYDRVSEIAAKNLCPCSQMAKWSGDALFHHGLIFRVLMRSFLLPGAWPGKSRDGVSRWLIGGKEGYYTFKTITK